MTTRTHLAKQEEAQTESGVQARAADPGAPTSGQLWINTTSNQLKRYTGSATVGIGGSGGGGGSLQWIEDALAPIPLVENSQQVYSFEPVLGQSLYAAIRVPNGYIAGSQINMRPVWYSADTSGTVLIKTVATLIRAATDAVSSTTNQRTSANTAVTVSAGTVNEPQVPVCDLTSSTGTINSVSVAAGDLILVRLTRDTGDTATGAAKVLLFATEVTFS